MEAFAYQDFRRYQMARLAVILGAEAQAVAVAWQVYAMTHRALDLGFTGLALFLPGLLFLLPAGHVADRFDRRHVILVCYGLQVLCTSALLVFAMRKIESVLPIYTVLFFIGTGRAFSGPASSALVPHLVPEEHFVNAVTWGGAIFQVANFTGPALGGLMYTLPLIAWWPGTHLEGAGIVYVFMLAMLAMFLVLMSSLKVRLGRMEHKAASVEVVLAGFKYVWSRSLLLGAISLDLFAVLLGGAVALMPIFASDILHTGPRGLGLLRAAPAVGALMTSLVMARFPINRRAGKRMFVAVAIFGVATLIFGLSRSLWISLGALAISGAADMISVIIRGSLMQLATPAEMRGRVSAVNSLFIGASNELGEFESGLTAQWWGAVRATVVGGVASIAVAAAWAGLFPELRRADRMTSEELRGRKEDTAEAAAGS
jgi:MFS family permease